MVWIGHCYGSHDIDAVNYEPGEGVGIYNNPGEPVGVNQANGLVTINDGHGYDHCVGISLGALFGIIIGIILAGVLALVIWRLYQKRKNGGDTGGQGDRPGLVSRFRGMIHRGDEEKAAGSSI